MQLDPWYWRRARSNPPPGCLWRLWQSAFTLTQPVRPDGNVFCWCRTTTENRCHRFWTHPHCGSFPTTLMMWIMTATIHLSWAVQWANPQSAWSKLNSPSSNLPNGWDRPTTVRSTSGRKNGWLGIWSNSISPLSRGSTIRNSFDTDPCTGRQQLQIVWRHSRTGSHWIISIMLNGFGCIGLWCIRRNVQMKFRWWGQREGEATRDWQWEWEGVHANSRDITSQSCHIQTSWWWFTGCQIVTTSWYLPNNSKPHKQMWGTGRSWLISLTETGAQKWHTC